jgi:lysophospholipase L1-like esterase
MRLRFLLAVLVLSLAPGLAPAGPIYLALGDSSAFGETDRTRNPSNGDRGYVAPFADYLGSSRYPTRPTVVNLAIDGETSLSWSSGLADRASTDGIFHNSNYAAFAPNYPTQQERFRQVIADAKAAGNTIGTVTVQFGANDLFLVAERPEFLGLDPAVQAALVYGQIGNLQKNYAAILTEVRAALPDAELYVLGYHNPYGGTDLPLAPLSAPAVQGVNQVAAAMAEAFGGHYASFYDLVLGREHELTLVDQGANVHLNDAGYALAASELIRVASTVQTTNPPANTPEPGTLMLVGVGALGAFGYRRLRRVTAE